MELKEMLCSSEANDKHLIDLEKKLTMAECELQDAERQIEDLIVIYHFLNLNKAL